MMQQAEIAAATPTPAVVEEKEHPVPGNLVILSRQSVLGNGAVSLIMDSGAVTPDVEISVLALDEEQSSRIPDYLANLTEGGKVYRLLPDGQKFECGGGGHCPALFRKPYQSRER